MTDNELILQRNFYRYGDKRQFSDIAYPIDTLIKKIRDTVEKEGYTLSRYQTNTGGYSCVITWAIHTGERASRSDLLPSDCYLCRIQSREGVSENSIAYRALSKLFTQWQGRGKDNAK